MHCNIFPNQRFVKNADFTNNDNNLERSHSLQHNLTNTNETTTTIFRKIYQKPI